VYCESYTSSEKMFKSTFAREILEDHKHDTGGDIQDAILPILRHNLYKSQFASSTHGPLDNIHVNIQDKPPDTSSSKFGNMPASGLDNCNIPGNSSENVELQTSDLGTSDFTSSEIWTSTSSSPFEYSQRYSRSSYGDKDSIFGSVTTSDSFLNLQSSMQFSYLKKVCKELDLGLGGDDWNCIENNLFKDINKNKRNISINNIENLVNLGDFLTVLQSCKEERLHKLMDINSNFQRKDSISEEDLNEHLSSKSLTAKLAAKELETLQVRLECQQLYDDNVHLREQLKHLKETSNPKKYLDLQKEIEHLHWQLNKMENSRKLYELATGQLVTFLEQVSSSLSTSNSSRGSRSTLPGVQGLSADNIRQAKRLSLASLNMARSQSMPGLVLADTLINLPKTRRIYAREKRVRRSSSASKTRVSSASPLPSLAEQDDPKPSNTGHIAELVPSISSHIRSPPSENQSSDSFPLYRRCNSVSDPLCVSTPKSYKPRLRTKDIESELSKRGTLTSISSCSSASPPSTDTSRYRDNCSSDSLASMGIAKNTGHNRLLSGPNAAPGPHVVPDPPGLHVASCPPEAPEPEVYTVSEENVGMASKAGKLLKTVKLMLAPEKSYNVSTAEEGGKRGWTSEKYSEKHRCSENPCLFCTKSMDVGPVLRYKHGTKHGTGGTGEIERFSSDNVTVLSYKQDYLSDSVIEPSTIEHIKANKNLSRQDGCETASNVDHLNEIGEKCAMCLQEKEMEGNKCARNKTASIKHRIDSKEINDVIKLNRSESDVREQEWSGKEAIEDCKIKSKSKNKFIKRSQSFQRIFRYSMLNRTREYKL